MASIIDRLFPKPEAKAVTGPGAFALGHHPSLRNLSRDPNRLMYEAQTLYTTNAWVGAAERTLAGRFLRMKWHLEDENGKTIDRKSPEAYQVPLKLLQRPSLDHWWSKLAGITFRHVGLPGNAIWYLDQRDGFAGTPLELLYINAARMTPVLNDAGKLQGWILDAPGNPVSGQQGRPGIPFELDEIIHFSFSEADWGVWGAGIAENAQRKIELDRLADTHAGGVLASGGRLTGLITPKENVTVNDDQWKQFVADYRRITDDPDAAKRLQVAKMPLDFTQMTASPKDLQLVDLSNQNRDTIFGLWGVPISERGFAVAAGLNSDLSTGYKETLWEAVKERAEPMRETIQYGLLDRWQALDVGVTLVFEYPTFEDNTAILAAVEKTRYLPLTNDERRDTYGLEPLPNKALGTQVWVDKALVRIDEIAEPELEQASPPGQSVVDGEDEEIEDEAPTVKARGPLLTLRAETEATWTPKMQAVVQRILDQQKAEVVKKTGHLLSKPKDTSWWSESREDKRFMEALEPLIEDLARDIAVKAPRKHQQPGKASTEVVGSALARILNFVRERVGQRITGINATTREKVQAAVAEGIEKGLSPAELGDLIEGSAAFDEYRAEMIARTETAYAYNDSAIQSYRELDVERVEVIDGDMDEVCAPVNGATWTMDEALSNPVGHPNCTRDFIPVVQ